MRTFCAMPRISGELKIRKFTITSFSYCRLQPSRTSIRRSARRKRAWSKYRPINRLCSGHSAERIIRKPTGGPGRLYVPAVLDTKKKPFSGTETPNKGIKQGLSRSIADFGSTCSLGWIADLRLMDREAITLAV